MTYTLETDGRTLEATEEQSSIIDFARENTNNNILIVALAGAAKTSTLRFLCRYLPLEPILSLAFNKRIADEMSKVLPGHVRCATMNSVGHRVWAAAVGKRLVLETRKNYNLVKDRIDRLKPRDREIAYDLFGDLTKTISRAKLSGYIPPGAVSGKTLITEESFFETLEEKPDDWFQSLINDCLRTGITQAYSGLIDFDDQIYMPTLFGGSFPTHRRVMVDEAQDLSPLNHAMVNRLVGVNTQLIAVGDPWQSIYAFRGADTGSMGKLREQFKMHEMTLSVSFRCPISVVKNAWDRVPHMKWPTWAKEGLVRDIPEWTTSTIIDRSAIICRNNAPLMTLALKLLRSGRGVQLVGTDLGPQLVKVLKKFGKDNPNMTRAEVLTAIDLWEREKLSKSRSAATVTDKAECLRVFAEFGDTLSQAITYCEGIFAAKGPIQLLSGHKSKGLEWDTVYHLDPERIPSPWAKSGEDKEQELNVRYVIETRSKESLYRISMTGLVSD